MFPGPTPKRQPDPPTLEQRLEVDRIRLQLSDEVPIQMEDLGLQGMVDPASCEDGTPCNHNLDYGADAKDLIGPEDGPHPISKTPLYIPRTGGL